MLPNFSTAKWRPFRAALFVAVGASAIIPMLHGVQKYGLAQLERQIGLSYVVGQGILYIVGAAIYAVRITCYPDEYEV